MSADPLANAIARIFQMDGIDMWRCLDLADAIREGALAEHLADVPAEALGFDEANVVSMSDRTFYCRRGGDTA